METQTPRFIDLTETTKRTGLGKTTILKWEGDKFPRAVRLSPGKRVWLESDVTDWILRRHSECVRNVQ